MRCCLSRPPSHRRSSCCHTWLDLELWTTTPTDAELLSDSRPQQSPAHPSVPRSRRIRARQHRRRVHGNRCAGRSNPRRRRGRQQPDHSWHPCLRRRRAPQSRSRQRVGSGAALLAGVGCGLFDIDDLPSITLGHTAYPDPDTVEWYTQQRQTYRDPTALSNPSTSDLKSAAHPT